jgi:hypothetical protein
MRQRERWHFARKEGDTEAKTSVGAMPFATQTVMARDCWLRNDHSLRSKQRRRGRSSVHDPRSSRFFINGTARLICSSM